MPIPTEPIGSVPRTAPLLTAMQAHAEGRIDSDTLRAATERAVAQTVAAMEATGSPVISDGEQGKPSFATYPLVGLDTLAPDGVVIPFRDGHTRQLPRLARGPFRYGTYSGTYVATARRYAKKPVKQAVISPSALSLLYPAQGIAGYPRDRFVDDLTAESAKDIRSAFDAGAASVQIDFTEGRLSVKLDPSRALLREFLGLINRVLEAVGYLPAGNLGTTDDCGFAPFGDDTSTARETAFAKIKARVDGTRLAEAVLGI